MEKRESFVLVLVRRSPEDVELRGRVRHVVTGTEVTFVGLRELGAVLEGFMRRGGWEQEEKVNG